MTNINKLPKLILRETFQLLFDTPPLCDINRNGVSNGGSSGDIYLQGGEIGIVLKSSHLSVKVHHQNDTCNNIIKTILVLARVCKLWLEIIPTLYYRYVHISTIPEFKELVHLSNHGILNSSNTPLTFKSVTIHLKDLSIKDKQETVQLFQQFLNDQNNNNNNNGCKCRTLRIHQINNGNSTQNDILSLVASNHSINDLQLVGRLPIYEYKSIPKDLCSHIDSLTIKRGITDTTSKEILESIFLTNYNNGNESNNQNNNDNNNNNHSKEGEGLKYLGLIDNQCNGVTLSCLSKVLENNNSLKQLDLQRNYFQDGQELDGFFESLALNNVLTKLDLSYNNLRSKSITRLSTSLIQNQTLTSLNLSNNSISDSSGVVLIDALLQQKPGTGIRELYIGSNRLSDEFGSRLCLLLKKENSILTHLDVHSLMLKRVSWPLIQSILASSSLKYINLNDTNLKPSSLLYLLNHIHDSPCKNITTIELLSQPYQIPIKLYKRKEKWMNELSIHII